MTTRGGILGGALPLLALASWPVCVGAVSAGPRFPGISRERYERYIALRNARDPAFALFHHDGVVMDSVPARTSVEHIVRLAGERLASLLGNAAKAGRVLKQRSMLFHGGADGRFKSVRAAPPFIVQDWI
jgi:hypothetical protein